MWPNPQFPADLVTFTEEILKGKFQFLYSVNLIFSLRNKSHFMEKIKKNRRGLKLVSSLSWDWKTKCLENFSFFSSFWVIPKITFANSHRIWPFESGNCGKERKKLDEIEYLDNEENSLDKIKSIFQNFWNAFFWNNINNREHKL